MSVRVMSLVWDTDLPPSEKLVLLALADAANDEGHCWPSATTIARKSGQGERTVRRAIQSLIEKKHLTQQQRSGTSAVYTLHPCQSGTPARAAPLPARHDPLPERQGTPARAAPKPSKNHKQPSGDMSADADPPVSKKEILEAWQSRMVPLGFPAVLKMTSQRERQLSARLRDSNLDEWMRAFDALERSAFCRGENDRGWRADFDFLLQPKSFTRLIEGAYDH